jgi:hypothetical protein
MGDKRQHKRLQLEAVDVNGTMVYVTKIEIIDISLGGLSLRADRRLNISCCYVIKLAGKNKTISVKGSIIWSKLSEIKPGPDGETTVVYTAGMQFNNVSPSAIPDLQEFIRNHRKLETVSLDDYRTGKRKSGILIA